MIDPTVMTDCEIPADSDHRDVAAADTLQAGPSPPGDRIGRRVAHHRNMLLAAAAVLLLAISLRTRADQRVEFVWLPGWPMPETCASRGVFNVECPGCGLTRSFIALAAGDLADAWRMNRTGWLLAVAVLCQFPYRLATIRQLKLSGFPEPLPPWLKSGFSWTLIAALIINWGLKIVGI
tara:strand:- start:505 stop:1041 length:537 start_codon:yes stop_codon:yes gene_type:complete